MTFSLLRSARQRTSSVTGTHAMIAINVSTKVKGFWDNLLTQVCGILSSGEPEACPSASAWEINSLYPNNMLFEASIQPDSESTHVHYLPTNQLHHSNAASIVHETTPKSSTLLNSSLSFCLFVHPVVTSCRFHLTDTARICSCLPTHCIKTLTISIKDSCNILLVALPVTELSVSSVAGHCTFGVFPTYLLPPQCMYMMYTI